MDAINDAFLLESSIYRLLKLYCREQPYYLDLIELFLQVRCRLGLPRGLGLYGTFLSRYAMLTVLYGTVFF